MLDASQVILKQMLELVICSPHLEHPDMEGDYRLCIAPSVVCYQGDHIPYFLLACLGLRGVNQRARLGRFAGSRF